MLMRPHIDVLLCVNFFSSALLGFGVELVEQDLLLVKKTNIASSRTQQPHNHNNNNNCDDFAAAAATDGTCFGRALKNKYFLLAHNFTNLNHGSFGTVPRQVAERQHALFLEQEAYPDTWFRKSYFDYVNESRNLVASLIQAQVKDVVLVENASSAVNAVLRSIGLERGDVVLRLSTAYGMVVETLSYLQQTAGIEVIVVDVQFPMTGKEQIATAVREALVNHSNVKLCVFSHISSMPAVIEPLMELVQVVKEVSPPSLILVDGAHAPGQIDLNVPSYDVDFYVGNCHKWLYGNKGTAFLWVAAEQQTSLSPEPTCISSSGKHDFIGRFSYTGTRDYTGFAALSAAFQFRNFLGGEKQIIDYCHALAIKAGNMLANAWNTSLLVPETMTGFMVNVILPSRNKDAIIHMQEQLNSTYSIYMVVGAVPDSNDLNRDPIYATRLSAQVYLEMDDFFPLAILVPALLKEGERLHSPEILTA